MYTYSFPHTGSLIEILAPRKKKLQKSLTQSHQSRIPKHLKGRRQGIGECEGHAELKCNIHLPSEQVLQRYTFMLVQVFVCHSFIGFKP